MVEDSTHQAQPQPTTDTKHGGLLWLIWLLLLPILYVLSIGPVARHYRPRPQPPPKSLVAFYAPIGSLMRALPPFAYFMDWYFRLWAPPTVTPGTPPVSTPQTSNTSTN
jgi:hypothetical protein